MPLNERLDTHKGVETAFGKIIPEKEAYSYCMRTEAAFSANVYQIMRILNPSWDSRVESIAKVAYQVNRIGCGGGEGELNSYLEAFYDTWNIPELVNRSAWIGAIYGDYGDEAEDMAGRVIQFTEDRVEKELDTCPWDFCGSEMCAISAAMFTANFDIAAGGEHDGESINEVSLTMPEARACGNEHCRVVAERLDHYGLEHQGWLEHRKDCEDPVHDTPPERRVKHAQGYRCGQYTNTFGEENSLEWQYNFVAKAGWGWSVGWPLLVIPSMAESPEQYDLIFDRVFATAGKNMFIDPFAREGLRSWLEIPREIGDNDPRVMGAYMGAIMGCQLLPFEWEAFDKDGVIFRVSTEGFDDRVGGMPLPLAKGYEVLWHNAVKTLVSPEWSVWFDKQDDDTTLINVGRKIDPKMV